MTKAIYKVTDANSTWFGREGTFVAVRGGLLRLCFSTSDRTGKSETTWHFNESQVEMIEKFSR
jgi:hypothetical protein